MIPSHLSSKRAGFTGKRNRAGAVSIVGLALVVAGCGSSTKSTTSSKTTQAKPGASTTTTIAKGSGPVNVAYAGSLVDLLTKQVGPAFQQTTGYTFTGFSGGSSALATQIMAKTRPVDVFISASPAVNKKIEGVAGGNAVSWYASFATSPLVLAYNPNSKFAADLKSMPWYKAIAEPSILVGHTDPATDPKGALTVTALNSAAATNNEPALTALATSTDNVFPEETLVGRLQAGQLDAGFFYAAEAKATMPAIPTVPITGQTLNATYTITILNGAPDEAGAEAFVKYLLGSGAASALNGDGFSLVNPPMVSGTGVPAGLKSVIPAP